MLPFLFFIGFSVINWPPPSSSTLQIADDEMMVLLLIDDELANRLGAGEKSSI